MIKYNRVFIYGLCDPETQQLRYIGATYRLQRRYNEHLWEKRDNHRVYWIAALKRRGLAPEMFIIEEVDRENAFGAERFWIAYFKSIGADPVNSTDGGIGNQNASPEARYKMGNFHRGKPAWNRGIPTPPSIKEKQREAHRGFRHSEKSKQRMKIVFKMKPAMLGKHHTEETKRKISETKKYQNLLKRREQCLAQPSGS